MPNFENAAGGAGSYVKALLPELGKLADVKVVLSFENYKDYACPNVKLTRMTSLDPNALEPLFEWCDVYYDPQNGLLPKLLPARIPVVVCIFDLQHKVHPTLLTANELTRREQEYDFAIRRADAIHAISLWEKDNFRKYFGKEEVYVIYLAPFLYEHILRSDPGTLTQHVTRSSFYLYPAVMWPHKNHYRLLEAFKMINDRRKDKPIGLILTGARELGHVSNLAEKLYTHLGRPEYVSILGYVSDIDLARLMLRARGLIFPSLYEGFGIPIVDAMSFQTPVLASKLAAIPEVAGDTISYFEDPHDSISMANDIVNFDAIITQQQYDTRLAKERAQLFSTGRIVKGLLAAFEETIFRKKKEIINISALSRTISLGQRKTFTTIVDLDQASAPQCNKDRVGSTENYDAANLQFISQNSNIVLLMPGVVVDAVGVDFYFRDTLSKHVVKKAYYNGPEGKKLALRLCLDTFIDTDYFMVIWPSQIREIRPSKIAAAIHVLDYFGDIDQVQFDNSIFVPQIVKPKGQEQAIRLIEEHKKDPVHIFYGTFNRTSVCRKFGMVGSVSFLSHHFMNSTVVMI